MIPGSLAGQVELIAHVAEPLASEVSPVQPKTTANGRPRWSAFSERVTSAFGSSGTLLSIR